MNRIVYKLIKKLLEEKKEEDDEDRCLILSTGEYIDIIKELGPEYKAPKIKEEPKCEEGLQK